MLKTAGPSPSFPPRARDYRGHMESLSSLTRPSNLVFRGQDDFARGGSAIAVAATRKIPRIKSSRTRGGGVQSQQSQNEHVVRRGRFFVNAVVLDRAVALPASTDRLRQGEVLVDSLVVCRLLSSSLALPCRVAAADAHGVQCRLGPYE